jgi:L,D-transpeptidase ErfK/SrfK
MRRQPTIVRCFIALCFSAAATLVAFEWRNPFPDPIITPETVANIHAETVLELNDEPFKIGPITLGAGPDKASDSKTVNPYPATEDKGFKQWLQALTAAQPAETSSKTATTQLILSLNSRLLEVRVPGETSVMYEVAVGQADWQTPLGEFKVINKLEDPAWQHPITKEIIPPGLENPLGTHWIGFWSDGKAQIGFHGTDQEDLIGEAVSHGCVRMRNKDIQKLFQQVDVGTFVKVVP